MRRPLHFLILTLALAAGGCSILPGWLGGGISISSMSINYTPGVDPNGGISALDVDLVMFTDPQQAALVSKMTSADWFRTMHRDAQKGGAYPDGIVVQTWQLEPGQFVRGDDVNSPSGLLSAVVFASYASAGDHRLSLAGISNVKLVLDADDMRLVP